MRVYERGENPWYCGHWNGSPLEIALTPVVYEIYANEAYHYHEYHEYYVVLRGRATLRVEGEDIALVPETIVMVQPGERHRVTWVDPDEGVQWVVIKERSVPGGKIVVPE